MRVFGIDNKLLTTSSGRTIGRTTAEGVIAAAIACVLIAGMYIAGTVSPVPAAPSVARSFPLGIDLPVGANRAELPNGLTDYLRPAAQPAAPSVARSFPLGIDLPAGASRAQLPAGLTDYLRAR